MHTTIGGLVGGRNDLERRDGLTQVVDGQDRLIPTTPFESSASSLCPATTSTVTGFPYTTTVTVTLA
jgi:hypothetical protein